MLDMLRDKYYKKGIQIGKLKTLNKNLEQDNKVHASKIKRQEAEILKRKDANIRKVASFKKPASFSSVKYKTDNWAEELKAIKKSFRAEKKQDITPLRESDEAVILSKSVNMEKMSREIYHRNKNMLLNKLAEKVGSARGNSKRLMNKSLHR